jgi:hypothetical protein
MNLSLTPFKVKLFKGFLYGEYDLPQTLKEEDLTPAQVIGISSYTQQPLTFHLLIEDAYLYSDVPACMIFQKPCSPIKLTETLCPGYSINHFVFESFKNKKLAAYDKGLNIWVQGLYLCSIDFYEDNELLHLVRLDRGQYGFFPNHKVNWKGQEVLAKYEKNRFIFTGV